MSDFRHWLDMLVGVIALGAFIFSLIQYARGKKQDAIYWMAFAIFARLGFIT